MRTFGQLDLFICLKDANKESKGLIIISSKKEKIFHMGTKLFIWLFLLVMVFLIFGMILNNYVADKLNSDYFVGTFKINGSQLIDFCKVIGITYLVFQLIIISFVFMSYIKFNRKELSYQKIDKRIHLRYAFSHPLKFIMHPIDTEEILDGVTINISDSGLCFCSSNILGEGQEIKFVSKLPFSFEKGSVRWSKKINDNFYKFGLLFS
jgi:hypothetical protein